MNRWKYALVGLLVGAFAFPLVWNSDPSVIGQTVTVDSTQSPLVVNAAADLADLTPTDGQLVVIKTGDDRGIWYYDKDSSASVSAGFVLNGPGSVGRFTPIDCTSGPLGSFTVATVADLATASPSDDDIVITLGAVSIGDGGSRTYRYDADSSATADGVNIVTGPGSVGRYEVLEQPLVGSATTISGSEITGHLLLSSTAANTAGRFHIEPNGHPTGTKAKIDMMFDPYEDDGVNYRIVNVYTTDSTDGAGGHAVIGAKAVGSHWGVWPSINFAFSDNQYSPMKIMYFDTSDTTWRTPMLGGWREGLSVTSGDYCTASNNIYQASSAGTTGATIPSHAAGTVSDGAVDWDFVRDVEAASASVKPVVMIGDLTDMPLFGHSSARMQIHKQAIVKNGIGIGFVGNANTVDWQIVGANATDDLQITNGTQYLRFDKANKFVQNNGLATLTNATTITDLSTTPSISGAEYVYFNNGSSTNVASFSSGLAYQKFFVTSANANTTLVHSASIQLEGATNLTLGSNRIVQFIMNAAGTVATQVY